MLVILGFCDVPRTAPGLASHRVTAAKTLGDRCWARCLYSGHDACPKCRCELEVEKLQWNEAMEMYLGSVRIKCDEGCPWTGALDNYTAHLRACLALQLRQAQENARAKDDEIKRLTAQLKTNETDFLQERADHKNCYDNLTRMFEKAMDELQAKQKTIADMDTNLDERNYRIRALKRILAARVHQIVIKDQVLKEQHDTIVETDAEACRLREALGTVLGACADFKKKAKEKIRTILVDSAAKGKKRKKGM